MSRPGFVLEVDRSTPPMLFHHGEGVPARAAARRPPRVIYPRRAARAGLKDPDAAIRHALLEPAGDCDPLPDAPDAGHEADDRLRRHLAAAAPDAPARHPPARHRGRARPGRRGRRRRRPPHRRPRPAPAHDRGRAAPRRRRPGLRRLRPRRPALQPRRRGPRRTWRSSAPPTRARRSRSTSGRPRATCSSTSTSTSSPWTAATRATATGLASYRSLRHHHNVHTMQHSRSFMDQHNSELHSLELAHGRGHPRGRA